MTKRIVIFLLITFSLVFCDCKHHGCRGLLERFSHLIGEFMDRSAHHVEPFTFCNETNEDYRLVLESYENLTTSVDNVTRKNCKDVYFNTNRINLLEIVKGTADKLWNSAYCNDCYEPLLNYSQKFVISNFTNEFYGSYYKNYMICLSDYDEINKTDSKLPPEKRRNITLCDYCEQNYTLLNTLFDGDSKHKKGQVCFDITDVMNRTRKQWSGEFKCCSQKKTSMTAFISVASAVIVLIIGFYTFLYVQGIRNEDNNYDIIDEREATTAAQTTEPVTGVSQQPGPSNVVVPAVHVSDDERKRAEEKRKKLIDDNSSDDDTILPLSEELAAAKSSKSKSKKVNSSKPSKQIDLLTE